MYIYLKGHRYTHYFDSVVVGVVYDFEIDLSDNLVTFILTADYRPITVASTFYSIPKFDWGYILFPYIGGRKPARVDTKIDLTFC